MKRILLAIFALGMVLTAHATKVYINPGHGSWGPNCRPMATINYAAGDTLGFFESNTNLWKAFALETKLNAAGFSTKLSRRASGGSGTNSYNKALSTICSEATNYGADYYISIHSNAGPDGSSGSFANYPVILYRGYTGSPKVKNSDKMSKACVARLYDIFYKTPKNPSAGGGPEFTTSYSPSNPRIVGDLSFYNTSSTYGYLGALKHNIPGYLSEGYFHTYSPARHRALNPDWCREEGIRYYRGIMDYYSKAGEKVGYILGYVRTKAQTYSHKYYIPHSSSNDKYLPINGAKIVLRNAKQEIVKCNCYPYVKRMLKNQSYYTTDHNYNGIFFFENLAPGKYTLYVHKSGYKDLVKEVTVTADKTLYPELFLEKGTGTEPNIAPMNPDIKWVLNGGYVPGGKVPSNADLWTAFMEGYNTYYTGHTNADGTKFVTRTTRPITEVLEFTWTNIGALGMDFMTNSKSPWKWLGDYIQSVGAAQGITISDDAGWRQQFYAFFNCTNQSKKADGSVVGSTIDFRTAGKPEQWGNAYLVGTGSSAELPYSVSTTYTIPTPVKEGDTFVGWNDKADGTGTTYTTLPAGFKGTLYAIWKSGNTEEPGGDTPTPDVPKPDTITWILNGGKVNISGGGTSVTVPTQEELWTSFKAANDSLSGLGTLAEIIEKGKGQPHNNGDTPCACRIICKPLSDAVLQAIFDKAEWKWLKTYIMGVQTSLTDEISSSWRYAVAAFFLQSQHSAWPASADFSTAGKPEKWGDAYKKAHGDTGGSSTTEGKLPSTITADYEIPTPTKDGFAFVCWNDREDGTGAIYTVLHAGWTGTLYAIWKQNFGTVTYELNGGKLNPYGWTSKEDMWKGFMADYRTYYKLTETDCPDRPIDQCATFTYKGGSKVYDMLADEKSAWKWLHDYILEVAVEQGHDATLVDENLVTKEATWRYSLNSFFNNTLRVDEDLNDDGDMEDEGEHVWPHTADFTESGKEQYWYMTWGYALSCPTTIATAYTLPTPVKEGDTFVGWYNNANGTGEKLTTLSVGYGGTIYAIWKSTPANVENVRPTLDVNAPMYDVLGRPVDATYRGIIIQNGNKYLLR